MDRTKSETTFGIVKTMYLFLLQHDLQKSADILRIECDLSDEIIESIQCPSILLKACNNCSENKSNQTTEDRGDFSNKKNREDLFGGFLDSPLYYKEDNTYVFYVCDHSNHHNEQITKFEEFAQTNNYQLQDNDEIREYVKPPEFVKLKYKFEQLQQEHKKLIAVTSELTSALQVNVLSQTNNIDSTLKQCKSIYPSLFNSQSEIVENQQKDAGINYVEQSFNPDGNNARPTYHEKEEVKIYKNNHQNSQKASSRLTVQNGNKNNLQKIKDDNAIDDNLRSESQLKIPLTPEIIRNILESVFERIFQKQTLDEKADSPTLDKTDIANIAQETYEELQKTSTPYTDISENVSIVQTMSKNSLINDNKLNRDKPFNIDFQKLKKDLINEDNDRKIRLLQALRWRITKTDPSTREKVMASYVSNDILNIKSKISISDKLPQEFNNDGKILVQESACRLINTLASLRQGRDYLTENDKLLKTFLIKKIKDIKRVPSTIIIDMLIASVQKLSIRKKCRALMISEGLFEFLIDYLNDNCRKLTKYGMEYCSALLMNLSLVDEAKERSTKISKQIINLIIRIFESKNENCLPYMNGMMFILFEKNELVREAKNQELDKLLIKYMQTTKNENLSNQLDYIIQSRILRRNETEPKDDDDDDQDEVDLLEIELDQHDFTSDLSSGEKLLEEYIENRDNPRRINNSVASASFPVNSLNSVKSHVEATKSNYYQTQSLKGIFDKSKPYQSNNVFLKKIHENMKLRPSFNGRFPATSRCYMENCKKFTENSKAQCFCSNCVPGQNRYTCGCYDAILKEVSSTDLEIKENKGKYSQLNGITNTNIHSTSKNTSKNNIIKDTTKTSTSSHQTPLELIKTVKDNRMQSACQICGERKCECAFESRPKLNRTPTS